jgi:D-amino acid aminotransferase
MTKVWLNDGLVPADEARISVFDRGFRSGEGIFETVRAYGTHPFRLDAHLARAEAGAHELGFAFPPREDVAEAIRATATANAAGSDLALRLTVTPGPIEPGSPFPGAPSDAPTLVVTAHPLEIDPDTYRRGVRAAAIPRSRELPGVKAVSYLTASLARREAQERGASEALLVTPDEEVLEGSYSNVFAVIDGTPVTPPLEAGILAGVTRAVVLEIAGEAGVPVDERSLPLAALLAAEEAFLTASTREIVPIVSVDGHDIGDGTPGPVTTRLLEGYRAEVRREIAEAET